MNNYPRHCDRTQPSHRRRGKNLRIDTSAIIKVRQLMHDRHIVTDKAGLNKATFELNTFYNIAKHDPTRETNYTSNYFANCDTVPSQYAKRSTVSPPFDTPIIMKNIKNGVYLHYKGNLYVVTTTAIHTETQEQMVIYYSKSKKHEVWVRPAGMFTDYVDQKNGSTPRFRFIRSIIDSD